MHVVIFGAGGIGGFLAGRIGAVLSKPDHTLDTLSIIARGEHLKAIQSEGLMYRDPEGNERTVFPSLATDTPGQLPRADIIFLCVKGYDLDGAVEAIERIVHNDTIVLPLLNGADIYDRVREKLPKGRVLPGAIYISSSVEAPGVVSHTGGKGLIVTGPEPVNEWSEAAGVQPLQRADELLDLLGMADIPFEWHDDPLPAIWGKYVFIAPFCLVTGVSGRTIGEVCADPALNADVRAIIDETASVGRANGVALSEDIVEQTMTKAASFPHDTKTSFQRDIEQNRAKDERDLFGSTVIRLAKRLGIDTPVTEKYQGLLP